MSSKRWNHLGLVTAFLLGGIFSGPAFGWGSMCHGFFTDAAIDRTPGALGDFLRANRDFLVCYSVLPDDWWGSPTLVPQLPAGLEMPAGTPGRDEVDRHFFAVDDDAYSSARPKRGVNEQPPIDRAAALAIFQKYVHDHGDEALQRFIKLSPNYTGGLAGLPEAMMNKAGQVVWVVQERLADLVAAMKAGNWKRALFLSTILGHYLGDAHVPLHTATDYNGAFHPNPLLKGIHARWEARMLERHDAEVKASLTSQLQSPRPEPLTADKVEGYIFKTVNESFSLVDNMYAVDDELLRQSAPSAATLADPNSVYTEAYFAALYGKLGPGAKSRLWQSAEDVALFWQLAWELAGKPAPPAGKLDTPALFVIDFKHNRLVPYNPAIGPRE